MERQPLLGVAVWPIIHTIRADVVHYIDAPLTFEALTAPDLTYTLVRPLEEKYNAIQRAGNKSVVFAFLLNRVYFIRDENNLTDGPLSATRAALCELLAIRILRDNGNSLLDLVCTLTTSWRVWCGAEPHVLQLARQLRDDDLEDNVGNAIEMAIISRARRFIKSSPCQRVIHAIWIGKCVYQPESSHAILSDRYKRTPIHFYDPHKAPLLDHYRLKVPAIRAVLEYINFLILFILFVITIEMNQRHRINTAETIFMVYALGFTLEKLACMQEHGIRVYFKGTWNGFDLAFGLISLTLIFTCPISSLFGTVTAYLIYAVFRIYGIVYHDQWARDIGIDFLAVIACLLFPRLAFVTLKNNLMVLSLRAMMMQFVALMLIAAFCFCGFLYALWTLGRKGAGYSLSTIAWWLLDIWFGLDAAGFDRAGDFDPVFGPILMIMYACLSNTLLLTVLVSILSNTFARINEDAAAEAMFRKAVSTIEGVKADPLFSYQPPINLVAVCILLPANYILSPRWFHKVNVFLIRVTNFPILLLIAWYERQAKKTASLGFYETISSLFETMVESLPRLLKRLSLFEGLAGSGADIDVIFEIEDDLAHTSETEDDPERILTEAPHSGGLERGVSRKSSRPSTRSLRPARPPSPKKHHPDHQPQHAPPRAPSPQRNAGHHRQISVPMSLRRRLTPSIHKPDVAQSPLAQIFQPLVLDDAISDTASGGGGSAFVPPPPPPQLSYGPATRRRLPSMQSIYKRPSETSLWATKLAGSGRPAYPPLDTRPETLISPLSVSPDHQEGVQREEERGIATVEQVEEAVEENGGMSECTKRMERIEVRQERIEELLVQLHARLQR